MLKYVFSVLLMLLALYIAGFSNDEVRTQFFETLNSASPILLIASYLATCVLNALSSYKWKLLLFQHQFTCRFIDLFAIYYIGKFYNLFLPTSIGGDAMRAVVLTKKIDSTYHAIASIFAERIYGLITLLFFAGLTLIFCDVPVPLIHELQILLGISLVSLAIFSLLIPLLSNRYLLALIAKLPTKAKILIDRLSEFANLTCIKIGLLYSILFYIVAVYMIYVTTQAFAPNFDDWKLIIVLTPIILFLVNIPISYAGLGVLELAYTLSFEWAGLGAELGLSVALFIRFKSIVDALIGGAIQHRYI